MVTTCLLERGPYFSACRMTVTKLAALGAAHYNWDMTTTRRVLRTPRIDTTHGATFRRTPVGGL
jgi:hypothetical protein